MKNKILTLIVLCGITSETFAFSQAACMKGIEESSEIFEKIGQENLKLSETNLRLMLTPDYHDENNLGFIMQYIDTALAAHSYVSTISIMRQVGSFKRQDALDKLIKGQFNSLYRSTKNMKDVTLKYSEKLKNTTTRLITSSIYNESYNALEKLKNCE